VKQNRIPGLALAACCALAAGAACGATVMIEDFENELARAPAVKSGWETNGAPGSTASIIRNLADAKAGKASGEVALDVKAGGWALVQKKIEGEEWLSRQPRAISFWLKGGGSGEVTVELEESYAFKWRKKIPLTDVSWQRVTIQLSDFACDSKPQMNVSSLVVLKFVGLGGSPKFLVDDIQVECGDKPAEARIEPKDAAVSAPAAAQARREFVRRISENGRYLLYDDGKPFISIGQNRYNIAAARRLPRGMSVEQYLQNMAAHGQNTLRLWVEGDDDPKFWLEPKTGVFNEEQAKRIDAVFELAARYNIYIILTPWDTWRIIHVMPTAAYVVSGDMTAASDFIAGEKVRVLQQKKWKYMIDRWGSRPNLLAWELVNEIDVFKATPEAELDWVEKMGEFIRQNDPHRHLITVSFSARENDAVWRSPVVDIVGPHFYGNNPARAGNSVGSMMDWFMHKKFGGYARLGKPILFTEVGPASSGYEPAWVRNMMWASLASGAAGTGMRWSDQGQWGDAPPAEYADSAAVRKFCDFVDWRVLLSSPLAANRVHCPARDVRAFGVASDRGALVWVEGIAQDGRKYSPEVEVGGLSAGIFAIYFFDSVAGELRERQYLNVKGGAIRIRAPEFAEGMMCYLESVAFTPDAPEPHPSREAAKSAASAGDANGRVKCVRRAASAAGGPKFGWEEGASFAVDASVPGWHRRFATRISDGTAPDNDADLSARLYTAWDDKSFYVMARVRDEVQLTHLPPDQAFKMDSMELYFDSANDKKRRSYLPELNRQVVIVLNTASGGGPQVFVAGKSVGSAQVLVKPDGYTLRAEIPFDALGFRPAPGKVIGFDVQLNDSDDKAIGRETAMAWAGGDNLNWCDPSVFGELEFIDPEAK